MSRHHHLVRVHCSNKATTQTFSTVSVCWGFTTFLQSIYSTYPYLLCKLTMGLDLFFWLVLCLPLNFTLLASTFYQVFDFFFFPFQKLVILFQCDWIVRDESRSCWFFLASMNLKMFAFFFFYWVEGFDFVWLGSWLYQPVWCFFSD